MARDRRIRGEEAGMPVELNGMAQRGGAKALLLTVLGEFVLPSGGEAWTSTLVAAADALDIGEKNARQAVARIADDGLIESHRHGRLVRWSLTTAGRELLVAGTTRIYEFGTTTVDWEGEWLLAHCPVPESQRALRHRLRTRLAFEGFGELSPSLAVSSHVHREPELRRTLTELGLMDDSVVLRSRTGASSEDAGIVERAWDLDGLATDYREFTRTHHAGRPVGGRAAFRAVVDLVHDWRRFPFIDPELPTELLPDQWAGATAAEVFRGRHAAWSPTAHEWWASLDEPATITVGV